MTEESERFAIEITEILPADLPRGDYRPKGIKRFDSRKTCLDCGYLRYVRIRQVDINEKGNPVFERTEGLVNAQDRSEMLLGGNNQINARDLNCFRDIWGTMYSGDVRNRIEQGLKQATMKRRCKLFFSWSPGDTPQAHRELHRERTARFHNIIGIIIGAVIGGLLSLGGTLLYWFLSGQGGR